MCKTNGSYQLNCNSAPKYNSVGYNEILFYNKNSYKLCTVLLLLGKTNLHAVKHFWNLSLCKHGVNSERVQKTPQRPVDIRPILRKWPASNHWSPTADDLTQQTTNFCLFSASSWPSESKPRFLMVVHSCLITYQWNSMDTGIKKIKVYHLQAMIFWARLNLPKPVKKKNLPNKITARINNLCIMPSMVSAHIWCSLPDSCYCCYYYW